MKTVEIYFRDIIEEAQRELLDANKISSPEEANWDVYPLITLFFEDDDE